MAKSTVKFFGSNRRECEVGDFHSLKSKGNERRVKANFRLPLSNRPAKGMPDWVSEGYTIVAKDDSFYSKMICKDVRLEGMSLDLFSTDSIKKKMRTLNGATLDAFSVERVGKDDKAVIYLNFVMYCPCSLEIIQWFYEMQGSTVFAEFDATQASLAYDGEDEEDEEDAAAEGAADANGPDPSVHTPVTKGRGKAAAANDV